VSSVGGFGWLEILPFQIMSGVGALVSSCKAAVSPKPARWIRIDKSVPWSFFDETWKRNSNISSVECLLYFSHSHFIKFKAWIGLRSNNYAELQALRLLLKCAKDQNIKNMQVFNNSSLVINWIKESGYLHNIHLKSMGDLFLEVAVSFEHITFTHVYRNLNQDADRVFQGRPRFRCKSHVF
jgi:ribonuclease HI